MRITKLSLTNFRSFKETQTIDFAPVTLLFGPNSVGKSSVLMALFYLQQILGKDQCNPMRIDALGNKHIGGFKKLVNGNDLDKPLTIAIEFDKENAIGKSYYKLIDLFPDALPFYLESTSSTAQKVELVFELRWSNIIKDAYISKYTVRLDGIGIALTESSADKKQTQIIGINYLHPLLKSDKHGEFLISALEKQNIHPELVKDAFSEQNLELSSGIDIKSSADDILNDYINNGLNITDDCYVGDFHELLAGGNSKVNILGSSLWHDPIGIKSKLGGTPVLGEILESTIDLEDETQSIILSEILSDILVAPLDNLMAILNESLCIGPLRHIPDSNYLHNPYPTQADWYDGKACWDELLEPSLIRDAEINEWLVDKDKLNLGYQIAYKTENSESRYISPTLDFKKVEDVLAIHDAVGEQLKTTISKEDLNDNSGTPQAPISNEFLSHLRESQDFNSSLYIGQKLGKHTKSTLWDCHNNIEVSASEIGVGVSQLLPLVVASKITNKGLIACEQPELHVHPRVQVAIGDLLTQANSTANFLIETHSEHLILRLLKRIRQTTDSELPDGFKGVKPEDISIVYIEPTESGVTTRKIEVDGDGEFKGRWPNGFFSERRKELM